LVDEENKDPPDLEDQLVTLGCRVKQDQEDSQDCLVYLDLLEIQVLRETEDILEIQDQQAWVWRVQWVLLVYQDLLDHLVLVNREIRDVEVPRVNQVTVECLEDQVLLDHLDTASSVTLWPPRQTDRDPRRDLNLCLKAIFCLYSYFCLQKNMVAHLHHIYWIFRQSVNHINVLIKMPLILIILQSQAAIYNHFHVKATDL